MAKKGSLPLIYLIGMALVVIGFICPMFDLFIGTLNGFDFINFKEFGITTIGALLIIAGAVLGLVFCFVGGKNSGMLKLVGLLVSIAGGVVLIIGYSTICSLKELENSLLMLQHMVFIWLSQVGLLA